MKKIIIEDTFFSTVRDIENALRESNLTLLTSMNFRDLASVTGKSISGSKVYGVFVPELLYEVLSRKPDAGAVLPVRIYVYEEKSMTCIVYDEAEELLKKYDLGELGHMVDALIKELLDKVIRGRNVKREKEGDLTAQS